MAFGKVSKQDLIEAGLDPDKLAEFQAKGVTKDDLASLKTELATSVTDLIKAQFTELETKLKPQPVKVEGADDPNKKKTPEELAAEEQSEFYADPTGFVKKQVGGLGYQAAVEFKKLSRDLAFKEASKELPGFRNATLREEIQKEWEKYTPDIMARNNTDPSLLVKQVHDMIMGRHHDEIVQDRDKKDGKYNLVHGGSSGSSSGVVSSSSTVSGTPNNEITEQEKVLAKKFGMTEDEWKKQGEDMEKEQRERTPGLVGA